MTVELGVMHDQRMLGQPEQQRPQVVDGEIDRTVVVVGIQAHRADLLHLLDPTPDGHRWEREESRSAAWRPGAATWLAIEPALIERPDLVDYLVGVRITPGG